MAGALAGTASAELLPVAEAGAGTPDLGIADGPARAPADPRRRPGPGGVGIWRDAVPILARLDDVRRDVVAGHPDAPGSSLAILLFLIFRAAQGRLTRQTAALVEATRRDPLTGTLNHGALVAHLADEIERAREAGAPLGVALVDIDNFRLLNDNHGHRAGDQALLAVAAELRRRDSPTRS